MSLYQDYTAPSSFRWPGGAPMKRPDGSLVCSSCGLLFDPGHDQALLAHWKHCGVKDEDEGTSRRHLVTVYHLDARGEVESVELRMEREDGEDDFLEEDDDYLTEETVDLLTCEECPRCGAETVQDNEVNDCTACSWGFAAGPDPECA